MILGVVLWAEIQPMQIVPDAETRAKFLALAVSTQRNP